MKSDLQLFEYSHIDNKAVKTCFLFHGTGGSKEDLLFLNQYLEADYNFVGLQGNVDEHGSARFFKRLSEGVFDLESIQTETQKLNLFIQAWSEAHGVPADKRVGLGYSNGANILLATLFYFPDLFKQLVLLHPMLPMIPPANLNLSHHRLFVSMGDTDQMIPLAERSRLIETLKGCQAQLTLQEYASGHQVTSQEIKDAVQFLKK
jgi:phospholipase/carboxylesterase